MNRRSFLRNILAASAVIPTLGTARKPAKAFPGYWVKARKDCKCFAIEAVTNTFVWSPRQNATWTVKAGETATFADFEDLYIYGGSHHFITPDELWRKTEEWYAAQSNSFSGGYEFPKEFQFLSNSEKSDDTVAGI